MAAAQPRSAVLAALHEDHRQLEVLSSRAAAAEEAVSHLDAADGKKVWMFLGHSFVKLEPTPC